MFSRANSNKSKDGPERQSSPATSNPRGRLPAHAVWKMDVNFLEVLKKISRLPIFDDPELDTYVSSIEEAERSGGRIPASKDDQFMYLQFGKPEIDTLAGDNLMCGLLPDGVVVNMHPHGSWDHPMTPPVRRAVYVSYPRFLGDPPTFKQVVFGYLPAPDPQS